MLLFQSFLMGVVCAIILPLPVNSAFSCYFLFSHYFLSETFYFLERWTKFSKHFFEKRKVVSHLFEIQVEKILFRFFGGKYKNVPTFSGPMHSHFLPRKTFFGQNGPFRPKIHTNRGFLHFSGKLHTSISYFFA